MEMKQYTAGSFGVVYIEDYRVAVLIETQTQNQNHAPAKRVSRCDMQMLP
jgi:hypothetical protein